jgi:lantibiotic transport system ATP-binding protein
MAREFGQTERYCVETIDLTHRFSESETALSAVNLRVIKGAIYGFLGPNDAGKTTTLKLILGLLKKQAGEIRVFGKSFAANRVEILRRTGTMIESLSLYGQMLVESPHAGRTNAARSTGDAALSAQSAFFI